MQLQPPPFRQKQSKQGSALLLTLLVVSLLMVLVLSLVIYIRMELRTAINRQDLFRARANARLGAQLGIARLQEAAGADARVTARADILSDTNPDDPDTGISPFNASELARFWTGAWDTKGWNPGDPADRQGRFIRWLVSLPDHGGQGLSFEERIDTVEEGDMPFNLNDDNDFLTLASIRAIPYAGGNPVLQPVRAGLKQILTPNPTAGTLETTGAYAWWVSDEGVKANPGLSDPHKGERQATMREDIPRFLFPFRETFSATEWFEDTNFDNDILIDRLRKAASLPASTDLVFSDASFSISSDAETALTQDDLFADYSLVSHGVLSSTRRGGLRGDLSLAFWRDPSAMTLLDSATPFINSAFEDDFRARRIFNYQDYPQSEQTIRSPAAATKNFFAPNWQVLRDFHNGFQRLTDADNESARFVPFPVTRKNTADHSLHTGATSEGTGGGLWTSYAHFDTHDRYAPDDPSLEMHSNSDGTGSLIDIVTHGFTPILLRWSMRYEIGFIEKEDASGNPVLDGSGNQIYHPQMRMIPTVVLWNPHNVGYSLQDQDTGDYLDKMGLRWSPQSDSRFDLTFDIENIDDVVTKTYRTTGGNDEDLRLMNSGGDFWTKFSQTSLDLNEFAPGEVKVFTINGTPSGDSMTWSSNSAMNVSNAFPPSDSYLTFSEKFQNDGDLEFLAGDPFVINTTATINEGPRPAFVIGSSNSNSSDGVQSFRLGGNTTGPHSISGTVNDVNTFYVGTLDLHMLPGPPEANHEFNPRRFANFNIRARHPKGGYMNAYGRKVPHIWFGFIPADIDVEKVATGPGMPMRGFWGPSSGAGGGKNFISLFDVPQRPPESIGQYQHANLGHFHPNLPTYPLGNSVADPHIDRSYAVDFKNDRTFIDLSWLLNDMLWDDYFLSTIDPYDIDGLAPSRLAPLRDRFVELDDTVVYDETGANPDETDYSEVAENLLLKGAFNVNSTSVEAWASLLASLSGEGIRYIIPESSTFATTGDLEYPFYRHTLPIGGEDTTFTGGPRNLSRSQIRTLAQHMVDEIKARGPFLSLSDFVNRRLSDDDRGLSGAIQSAIDRERIDIQDQNVFMNDDPADLDGGPVFPGEVAPEPSNVVGRTLDMAPGYLTQADVLTSIGPVISARSDTFIIRSYGHSQSSVTGTVKSQAWCEVLVQRMPNETDTGREFRIVNIRYLTSEEI